MARDKAKALLSFLITGVDAMQFKRNARHALLSLLLAGSGWGIAHAELVTDGGFESGDLDAWTVTYATSGSSLAVERIAPHSGAHDLTFAAAGGQEDKISQSLATTAGTGYTLSFWLQTESGSDDGAFHAYLNGGTVVSAVYIPNVYTEYSFDFFAVSANTVLSFGGYTANSFIDLDDVSVVANGTFHNTPGSEVAEPASLALAGIALAAAGAAVARRRARHH